MGSKISVENDEALFDLMLRYLDKPVRHLSKYDHFLDMLLSDKHEIVLDKEGHRAVTVEYVKEMAIKYNHQLLRQKHGLGA